MEGAARAITVTVSLALVVVYAAVIVVGHFPWNGRGWARINFIVPLALQILGGVHGMVMARQPNVIQLLIVAVAALCIAILSQSETKAYGTR